LQHLRPAARNGSWLILLETLEIVFKPKLNCFSVRIAALKKAIKLTKRKRPCKKPVKDYPFDRGDSDAARVFYPYYSYNNRTGTI
jgi:hypothetical protein